MQVYIFDNKTKEYLRKEEAWRDPVGGIATAPANGTFVEPIDAGDIPSNATQVFNKATNKWEVVPDYRGQAVVDTSTGELSIVRALGAVPDGKVVLDRELVQSYLMHPDYFRVYDGAVVYKTDDEIDETVTAKKQAEVRARRNAMLSEADWRVQRAYDARSLDIASHDDIDDLIAYRQYLRDITKNYEGWWYDGILTFEQFMEVQK